jgi:hypothetical protein
MDETNDERDQARSGKPDGGAFIGQQPEWAADSIPDGPLPHDERVAGYATQSTGEAQRAANPDIGWQEPHEGHTTPQEDLDDVRRAGPQPGSN